MADISVEAPHGSVTVDIDLATTRDGNEVLTKARVEAAHLAEARRRRISGTNYGITRDGDKLTLTFPLAELNNASA